jgi:hypothetical protein
MDILNYTKGRSKELAQYLESISRTPFSFEGDHPIQHSSQNHIHLWLLEYLADTHNWIDTEYKSEFVSYILAFWKSRLKGLAPYYQRGYRMYVYEDLAPTISVVAETDVGCPYQAPEMIFLESIREILDLYNKRSWRGNFSDSDWEISPETLMKVVEKNKGSIGKPTASRLGVQVGKLRLLIMNMGLEYRVNDIRKKNRRRPADFSNTQENKYKMHLYEELLQPNYR